MLFSLQPRRSLFNSLFNCQTEGISRHHTSQLLPLFLWPHPQPPSALFSTLGAELARHQCCPCQSTQPGLQSTGSVTLCNCVPRLCGEGKGYGSGNSPPLLPNHSLQLGRGMLWPCCSKVFLQETDPGFRSLTELSELHCHAKCSLCLSLQS